MIKGFSTSNLQLVIIAWGTSTATAFIPLVLIFTLSKIIFTFSEVDCIPHERMPVVPLSIIPFFMVMVPVPFTIAIDEKGIPFMIFSVFFVKKY